MDKDYYNNFFIGIPLKKEYLKEYKKFLRDLKKEFPYLKISKTRFPHVTVLFMGRQLKSNVDSIARIVDEEKQILEGDETKIRNFGRFKNDNADILYLGVEKTYQLSEFYYKLTKRLQNFSESEWKNFVPHLTMARVRPENKQKFEYDREKVEKFFSKIKFEFQLEEASIFGRDPNKNNKLVKISDFYVR